MWKASPVLFAVGLVGGSACWQSALDADAWTTVPRASGARRVLADFAWLAAYVKWEQHNAAATEALIALTTTLDPEPLYFWINGARMMAYDFPQWGRSYCNTVSVERSNSEEIQVYCAHRALRFLDEGIAQHPRSALLWIERANIQHMKLRDFDGAAESFRAAAALPGAPYYAARLYAEMLRRAGRKTEALAWLRDLYPKLPLGVEAAAADLVAERIRVLEAELNVTQQRS